MPAASRAPATFRLSLAHLLRIVAPVAITVGLVWVICAVAGVLHTVGFVLGVLTLLVAVLSVVALIRPPRVLRLSDDGYEVSLVRGVGERVGSWRQVEGVVTQPVHGALCLVVSLEGGRASVVPLSLMGSRSVEAQRDVHDRLNRAHGYRRLEQ